MRRCAFILTALCGAASTQSTNPPLREVGAHLVALHPGRPGSVDVLLTWESFSRSLIVDHDSVAATTASNGPVLRYEAQLAVSGSDVWTPLSDSISGLVGHRYDRHEVQKIVTRVDSGASIADGSFRLQLSHAGTSPLDMHQHTVTTMIPFDASEAQVQAALESLDVVSTVQVFKRTIDPTANTMEWTVLFHPRPESPSDHGDLPLLSVHSESITAPYSGPGQQVAVFSVRDGQVNDVVCETQCSYLATRLPVGTRLSFRMRALLSTAGWTEWSRVSEPLRIPSTSLPRPSSAPEFLSATSTQINIRWAIHEHNDDEAKLFPVRSFHVQQRCGRELSWRTADRSVPRLRLLNFATFISVGPLAPNTSCVFRVAATNANGEGTFSPTSPPMATQATVPDPPTALKVLQDPVRVKWDKPIATGGSSVVAYELQVRLIHSTTWTNVPLSEGNMANCSHDFASAPLSPFTRYMARVRAMNANGWGRFSDPVDFLTDFVASMHTAIQSTEQPSASAAMATASAKRHEVANGRDIHYVHGVGSGGELIGEDGEAAAVLLTPITADGRVLDEQSFFFIGRPQMIHIPVDERPQSQIVALRVYAWGAGGGSGGKEAWGTGGGGAFARGVLRVRGGDSIEIRVGGGGVGFTNGGHGGWNGGGDGGAGAFSGGGGGGASVVKINGDLALVAAGGGGGGSSDYCCAHGGGGGGGSTEDQRAESGLHPDALSIPLDVRFTGVPRNEYRSVNVEGDTRDETGLPARHVHLDYGRVSGSADYSVLATGGGGASSTRAGDAGIASSYNVSRAGELLPDADAGTVKVTSAHAASVATPGRLGHGGRGQDGQDCGGGGGGGYFGGGGGGAGIDGAGGGGGSSFVSVDHVFTGARALGAGPPRGSESVHNFTAEALSSTVIQLRWSAPPLGFAHPVEVLVVEMANRSANEDFRVKRIVDPSVRSLAVDGLRPDWIYRFRVKPLFRDAAIDTYSVVHTVSTPPTPQNVWSRVSGVRSQDDRAGSRIVDALPQRRLPSARRGHSLTAFDDGFVYMFGGFSGGYACNVGHKDACTDDKGVTNELWRLDTHARMWMQLRTVGGPPPAREKHSMAVISSHVLLFGGRKGGVDEAAATLNDLWSLKISSTTRKTTVTLRDRESNVMIEDGREVFTIGNGGDLPDMCVVDLVVTVVVTHACPHTLRIELLGPGPSTHPQRQQGTASPVDSQATETTWSEATGFGIGDSRVTPITPSARSFPVTLLRPEMAADHTSCLPTPTQQTFTFSSTPSSATRPLESLFKFRQLSARGSWTLSVGDLAVDGHTGTLDAWDISFTLMPCTPTFTWTNLAVTTGIPPSPRFQHSVIVYQDSMFVFGGRSGDDARPLTDLYRFDYAPSTDSGVWTTLMPLTTYRDKSFYHGRTMVLTPFDLLAVGKGLRTRHTLSQPHDLGSEPTYIGRKSVVEALTPWITVPTVVATVDGETAAPQGRYWSSAVYMHSPKPRILMYGGQDDTTLHGDLWELDLSWLTESSPLASMEERRLDTCTWRLANTVYQQSWSKSCGATAAMVTGATANECSIDTLLLNAWCGQFYQTITL